MSIRYIKLIFEWRKQFYLVSSRNHSDEDADGSSCSSCSTDDGCLGASDTVVGAVVTYALLWFRVCRISGGIVISSRIVSWVSRRVARIRRNNWWISRIASWVGSITSATVSIITGATISVIASAAVSVVARNVRWINRRFFFLFLLLNRGIDLLADYGIFLAVRWFRRDECILLCILAK